MEGWYTLLKQNTLKELLEVCGRIASNKTKRVIIAELMELDQENLVAATPTIQEMETPAIRANESPANREIRERLAWFGPNPTADIVLQVPNAVAEEAKQKQKREIELQMKLAETQQASSPSREHSTAETRKIIFSAFNENDYEIDSYLVGFERQCNLHRVATDEWVKEALLARYAVTPETYRQKYFLHNLPYWVSIICRSFIAYKYAAGIKPM
ncbi:Hypothetical predicted protein [Pelobates cultripes]|uniref:Uncharacterized protein n=1 Tax=Pelobates cultripes TaxID=61616 RepID=A0AAD1T056_PELCU|nr:Hypothetical predicted protein [Pelobates cultripes]